MTNKRQDFILIYLKNQGSSSREAIERYLHQQGHTGSKITILRDLDKLVSAHLVKKSGAGKATKYALSVYSTQTFPIDVEAYFAKDIDERELRSERFNFDVVRELYQLLNANEIAELTSLNESFRQKKARLSPRLLQKEFERLTVELAWKSSKIEGNTYTSVSYTHLTLPTT